VEYFAQVAHKDARILIPGAGNAHEAEHLFRSGFGHVHVLDLSEVPLKALQERMPDFPTIQLHHANFFNFRPSEPFDIMVEQTFFCAIDPQLRGQYAAHAASLLKKGGKLVGLLFNDVLNADKPPFGGNKNEYLGYFEPYFQIKHFNACHNSIKPRAGRELFICLEKR
jgi:thiopurine S-methyltransferase